jgi:hypothetical protein
VKKKWLRGVLLYFVMMPGVEVEKIGAVGKIISIGHVENSTSTCVYKRMSKFCLNLDVSTYTLVYRYIS